MLLLQISAILQCTGSDQLHHVTVTNKNGPTSIIRAKYANVISAAVPLTLPMFHHLNVFSLSIGNSILTTHKRLSCQHLHGVQSSYDLVSSSLLFQVLHLLPKFVEGTTVPVHCRQIIGLCKFVDRHVCMHVASNTCIPLVPTHSRWYIAKT